jgi:hypothetical protein
MNSVRHEANRHFRNKKREYLNNKIYELATNRTRTPETSIEE